MRGVCLGWQTPSGREKGLARPGVNVDSRSPLEWVFTILPIGRVGPGGSGGAPAPASPADRSAHGAASPPGAASQREAS
jgi:hypothetical protein